MLFSKLFISLPVAALALSMCVVPLSTTYGQDYDGVLEGVVEPAEAQAVVWVIEGAEVVARVGTDPDNGEFSQQVPAGTYHVYVEPQVEGYVIFEVPNVEINSGETTDLGTLNLEE